MASAQWAENLFLKIANVVAYSLFSWFNIDYIISPQSASRSTKQTYFTPDDSVFFVWPIIHLLLLGTVIYQFIPQAKVAVIEGISWWFPILATLNIILVASRANRYYTIAFAFSLLSLSVVWKLYGTVKEARFRKSWGDELFVRLPLSTWHGWSTVVVLLTAFEAFGVDATENPAGIWTWLFVFISLFFLNWNATAYYIGGLPSVSVATWTLWAIFHHQRSSLFIHWTAFAFTLLSIMWDIFSAIFLIRTTAALASVAADGEDGNGVRK